VVLPAGQRIVISDTVGFIRSLPKDLFAAFRATFEEAQDADLLLHVLDTADPNVEQHIATTEKLLEELELDRVPRLVVYNKADCLAPGEAEERAKEHNGVAVSALDKNTMRPLLERIEHLLFVARGENTDLLDDEPEHEHDENACEEYTLEHAE
jgi:GTP-binding protein HflX